MNPYAEIRKVPLDYQGVQSSAYSVQTYDLNKKTDMLEWKEVGTVGSNYLLVPNNEVKEMAEEIAFQSDSIFHEDKTYFDGKRYVTSYIAKDNSVGEVEVGDDVAIGFQMWNSYDGSTSLGFRMMLYRLICTNGMMSKVNLSKYRFRHSIGSDDWKNELEAVAHSLKTACRGDNNSVHSMINRFKILNNQDLDLDSLSDIRFNHISDIPKQLWGSIVDRFLQKNEQNGWQFLNAATDELWHKEKPTIASYNHNASIIDGLCNWVAA